MVETNTSGNLTGSGSSVAVQTTTYNALNLPTRANEANGTYKVFTYGNASFPYLVTSVQKFAPAGVLSETTYTYGVAGSPGTVPFANGVLLSVTQAAGTPDQSTVSYTYNNNGFPVSENHP